MTMPKLFQVVTLYRMQEGSGETLYRVRVQEVGPNTLVLEVPLGPKSIPVRIPPANEFAWAIRLSTARSYTFTTVALDVEGGDIPQLVVATPRQEDIRKVQRRNFFRVPVALEGKLKLPDSRGARLHVCDLSGGGFSFKSRLPWLTLEQDLSGTIRLPRATWNLPPSCGAWNIWRRYSSICMGWNSPNSSTPTATRSSNTASNVKANSSESLPRDKLGIKGEC